MRHGVLDILFDESTEPRVLKLRRVGIRVSRTVVPKFDDLVTAYKVNRQEMRGSRNGK